MSDLWSGKPFLKKTIVKFGIIFIVITALLAYFTIGWPFRIGLYITGGWVLIALVFFAFYYLNKQSFTYHITERSVRIDKSWIFGNYTRELTLDQISDIHINQGMLARMFNCGSLVFVTTTGLEVGARFGGGGVVGGGVFGGGGTATPTVVKGRGNMLWDILEPGKARELLMGKLSEWRQVYQQQKMATSLERIADRSGGLAPAAASGSVAEELSKLKSLYESGAITKEEYEKAKKKLLG